MGEGPLLYGVYVDDLLVASVVNRSEFTQFEGSPDQQLLNKALGAYQSAKLPVAPGKGVTAAECFTAWGTEVNAATGTVGAPVGRRLQLVHLFARALTTTVSTQDTLQSLLGAAVHPLMHHRPWFSVFNRAYRFTKGLKGHRACRVPADVADEFKGALLGLLSATADIRAPISTRLYATDATPTAAAVVEAPVSRAMVSQLRHFSEHKGKYVRLDGQPVDDFVQHWTSTHLPEVLREAVAGAPWKVLATCKFKESSHVNLQELRAVKLLLRNLVRSGFKREQLVILTDSRVVLGALGKGRSSSTRLNAILRSMLGWQVLLGVDLAVCWISTTENIADDPSRDVPLRPPVLPSSPEAARLIRPEITGSRYKAKPGAGAIFSVLEVFSGCGRLSLALQNCGFMVAPAMDAFPQKGTYVAEHDILNDVAYFSLWSQIKAGHFHYVHFGIPCTSWSCFQRLNPNSTRTFNSPGGVRPSIKEKEANELVRRVVRLCLELGAAGNYWSVENPRSSLVWRFRAVRPLLEKSFQIDFDQCMFGLSPAAWDKKVSPRVRIKKATRIQTNLAELKSLARGCDLQHEHVRCGGKARTADGSVDVSSLAGQYPESLCKEWARCVHHGLAARLPGAGSTAL
jgi:hypothetical protein